MPFYGLDVGVCVAARCREGVGEDEGADGVASVICTVGIEFSSGIIWGKVDKGLVDVASYLDIVWCLDELYSGERSFGNEASTVSGFCAPGDALPFDVTDETVGG